MGCNGLQEPEAEARMSEPSCAMHPIVAPAQNREPVLYQGSKEAEAQHCCRDANGQREARGMLLFFQPAWLLSAQSCAQPRGE